MLATVCARSCKILLLHLLIQAVHVAQIWRVLAIQCTLSYGDSATVVLPSLRYYTPNITIHTNLVACVCVCVLFLSYPSMFFHCRLLLRVLIQAKFEWPQEGTESE